MSRRRILVRSKLFGLAIILAGSTPGAQDRPDLVSQGEYVLRAAGCVACHTDTEDGAFLAGGRAIETPFGTFYSPNITPHRVFGIGTWDESDLERALTHGLSPDGQAYYPAFPYPAYRHMESGDIAALMAYLKTVDPVARRNRPHEIPWYLRPRWVNRLWNTLSLKDRAPDGADRSDTWKRGAYLARALTHCVECHSPRDPLGVLDHEQLYAGTRSGPNGKPVPNITPHRKTGIGRWNEDDIAYYLETGMTPGGDYAGGLMAEVVDEGTRFLTPEDRAALAHYIHSLPPIERAVRKRSKKSRGEFD